MAEEAESFSWRPDEDPANLVASAILTNSQVHWIHDDSDVKKFIRDFLAKHGAVINGVMRSELEKLVA